MKRAMLFLLPIFLFTSCGSDEFGNTRAYVEGKIVSEVVAPHEVEISLVSQNKTIAQTIPIASGSFVLSGPLFSNGFKVIFSRKVKAFKVSKRDCILAADSLSIAVPAGVSHLNFSEITVK